MKQKLRTDGKKMLKIKRNLLGINELTSEEIEHILGTTQSFKEVSKRSIKKEPTLLGHTIANFFLEPSTRTRTSFQLAAKRLSADVINISAETSAVAKGESLKDTAKTIQALGADLVVIRHSAAGAPYFLTKIINCPVINAGDGAHEHPTQALVDLYTIRERMGKIAGLRVAIVGDVAHSRVARSNILGLIKMGAEVTLVGPPTLIPLNIESLGAGVDYNFEG